QVMSLSARSLRGIKAQEARPKLMAALDDPSQRVRFAAAWALAPNHARLKAVRELMIASLKDSNPAGRSEAAKAFHFDAYFECCELARYAVPTLIEATHDSERDVRRGAAAMLGNSGCEEAVPALVAALEDADTTVRHEALNSISNLGNDLEESV